MSDFWACVVDEFQSLGAWCMIRGPEAWLCLVALCALSAAILLGMWLAALLSANGRDEDENKRDL